MKVFSLRLEDEEHAQLVASALHNQRSLQKEIIWRLFHKTGAGMVSEEISEQAKVVLPRETPAPIDEGGETTDVSADSVVAVPTGAPPSESSGAAEVAASPVDTGRSVRRARVRSRTTSEEGFKPDFGTKLKK